MAKSSKINLSAALSRDLQLPNSDERIKVVDDTVRKVFTANRDGAVLVFRHSQPDAAYWNGVKHYGSGATSKIRIRRTVAADTSAVSIEKSCVAAL